MMCVDNLIPFPVEPRDQVRDGIATPATGGACCRFIARSVRDSEPLFGAGNMCRRISVRATEPLQVEAFIDGERAQRILRVTGHGRLQRGEINQIIY